MIEKTFRAKPSATRRRGRKDHLQAAVAAACGRIGPVWDLKSFIAANSLRGFEDESFAEAVWAARGYFHADALMPLEFYRRQFETGRITSADLHSALRDHQGEWPLRAADLFSAERSAAHYPVVRTLAERIDFAHGTRYEPLIVRELTKWCSAYFDQGQAPWAMPRREQRLYAAWQGIAGSDAACRLGGIGAFQQVVEELPECPEDAIEELTAAIGVTPDDLADYLTRLLTRLPGWSGYALFRSQNPDPLRREGTGDLTDLVAMGLAYEWALLCSLDLATPGGSGWETVNAVAEESEDLDLEACSTELNARLVWQSAYERGFRRNLLGKLAGAARAKTSTKRPAAQAVFCIDVRSEGLRRELERQGAPGDYETFGFAGFFGFPIAHRAFGAHRTTTRCPALLQPKFTVADSAVGGNPARAASNHQLMRSLAASLNSAKSAAVSCYFYVESLGLLFGAGALLRTIVPRLVGRLREIGGRALTSGSAIRPVIDTPVPESHGHRAGGEEMEEGIPLEQQAAIAKSALTIMGLTGDFARIVLLCGHGSSSANNPYAAALDCGACGGHEGGANARVAAMVLNRREVRERLAGGGIAIPEDTCFVAGRHDTTTDDVVILDEDLVPPSHTADLTALKAALAAAGKEASRNRRCRFGETQTPAPTRRARDWSEVRPEWGLAGNAAFIVGPRELTAGVDLEGRAFLHSYDWRADRDGSSLEVILTAPLIVAEWINMQYFLSTVDNRRFGSGDKVIHNVVGKLGVMLGNHSDLQVGLPLQSVSNGERLVHEPLRLTAVVQAPRERIESIIQRHESLRRLVDNEWITLIALAPGDNHPYRYRPQGGWRSEKAA